MRILVKMSAEVLVSIALTTGCSRSSQHSLPVASEQAALAEEHLKETARSQWQDTIEPNEKLPIFDNTRFNLFKRDGRYYIGPDEYGFGSGNFSFYWPSKVPGNAPAEPLASSRDALAAQVRVLITGKTATRAGYGSVFEKAEKAGWIESRVMVRSGLERVRVKDVPENRLRGYVVYRATDLRTETGFVPTLLCSQESPPLPRTAGASFQWRNGLSISIEFDPKFCESWPEIYAEVARILSLIEEVRRP